MDDELVNKLVAMVVEKLTRKLGADGSKETILSVCTGCNGDVERVADQMKYLVMNGYKLKLFFSATANETYREYVIALLDGFPHITIVEHGDWYKALVEADAVVVPVASINTVSKLSMLMADSGHSQLVLNAMTMGKPLIIAKNGTLSCLNSRYGESSCSKVYANLIKALDARLAMIENYGVIICDLMELSSSLELQLAEKRGSGQKNNRFGQMPSNLNVRWKNNSEIGPIKSQKHIRGRLITASHVNLAAQGGYDLTYEIGGIITPMAKDLASQKGIRLVARELRL